MIDYFLDADDAYLRGMGADRSRFPSRDDWLREVLADQERPDNRKDRLYVGWFYDDRLVGHSSINQIEIGEQAYIHLHLWDAALRRSGVGTEFFRKSVLYFRRRLHLKRVICEPYAGNSAPNRVLEKLGFTFVGRFNKIPGPINYEQDVNRWELRL
ncbi:MAG: GNAT family N-acetyltransferase [Candidatus Eremiobacteraeota bacterium]|nr:GNAT family N-acetyltransferase [Candidatus Eremiobacteraeota bacterium]